MTDRECVEFLQWALPQLGLRWPGFRKVRRQVHKRIVRRLGELGLGQIADYRAYLDTHAAEWGVLDAMSRISISRFYRDRGVFDHLRYAVLPELAARARQRDGQRIWVWSAGCASGEEPSTVAIIWARRVQPSFPEIGLQLVATDADEHMLQRAGGPPIPPAASRVHRRTGWTPPLYGPTTSTCSARTSANRSTFASKTFGLRLPPSRLTSFCAAIWSSRTLPSRCSVRF